MLNRLATLCLLALLAAPAAAQDMGTLHPKPLPPLAHPDDPATPAKELFGRKADAAALPAKVIGFYSRGCLAGGEALPFDGATWQVMRLSRNRNWGHPDLVGFLEAFSRKLPALGWPGLLVGDMAQPRGGPMITGHASHQIGLDADIWFTPMPNRTLTREERETISATDLVRKDRLDIDPQTWSPKHLAVIRAAAREPRVQRIFVNPAIKKAICREATGDRSWLWKVRPIWGHNYHFHIRLACPAGAASCEDQGAPPKGEGCDKTLDWWFKPEVLHPKPGKPRPPLTMASLPAECRRVLDAR